jgi:hypothetical protein
VPADKAASVLAQRGAVRPLLLADVAKNKVDLIIDIPELVFHVRDGDHHPQCSQVVYVRSMKSRAAAKKEQVKVVDFASISGRLQRKVRRATMLLLENYYRQRIKGWLAGLNRTTSRTARPRPVVVSLTSTSKRLFYKTDIAIATLLCQKFRPDRLILWLSDELKDTSLPESFYHLMNAGLEVHYRRDVGPHTKVVYALQEFSECLVVSADDDILYPSTWLSDLYASYQRAPHHIHCHNAHLMRKDEQGKLLPYRQWQKSSPGVLGPSHLLFALAGSGVLYPPGSLPPEVFNVEALMRLCPFQDDVWLKAMALLQGTLCQKVRAEWRKTYYIDGTQHEGLYKVNRYRNDEQLHATFGAYDLYHLL